ncbi:hypothetical protein NHX12_028291 [Muraenolepis orangiensis]|uniref:Uncharacterized protein n=1 Tax=Muraenolepis orangiensis TaxID=630683 RepID=A0A9Q0EB58_9TELE|nr:hypothetical protein NHX12_028291 [Muraenolepis orangiensis]
MPVWSFSSLQFAAGYRRELRVSEQEEGELIVEGLLNISWGLRRPIRLQMQDDHERIRPPPSSTSWHSGCALDGQGSPIPSEGQQTAQQAPPTVEITAPDDPPGGTAGPDDAAEGPS